MATILSRTQLQKLNEHRQKAWDFFCIVMRSIYLFSPGIIFLAIYYFIIAFFPIGQDMLIQTGEYPWPKVYTNLSFILWMFLAWLSLRLLSNMYSSKHPDVTQTERRFLYHGPRVVAYNVAVGLQIAVINLPSLKLIGPDIQWLLFTILFLFHNGYYILLHLTFKWNFSRYKVLAWVFGLVYIAIIVAAFLIAIERDKEHDHEVGYLYFWLFQTIIYFLIQIIFVKIAVLKRDYHDRHMVAKTGTLKEQTQPKLWNLMFTVALVLAMTVYCFVAGSTGFANEFGTLGCLLLAMGLWVTIICLIRMLAMYYNIRFSLVILGAAILVGWNSNRYAVDLKDDPNNIEHYYQSRLDADEYLGKWFALRKAAIDSAQTDGKEYPIYLVLSDGGASKSGFWVASVLSKLEKESPVNNKFSSHLLSLAGASGGSVGNVAFYCDLVQPYVGSDASKSAWQSKEYPAAAFFESDFMTYTLAHFLGPDLFGHLIRTFCDDRGTALEHAMEQSDYNPQIGKQFSQPIENVFDKTGKFPMLFINVTNVELGSPALISSVKSEGFSYRMDVLSQVDGDMDKDIVEVTDKKTGIVTKKGIKGIPKRIKLSTAAVLGSRFPYVSPAGEINHNYFVDGGYYDNSGAGITLELMRHLYKRINNPNDDLYAYKDKICFKALYISNGLGAKDGKRIHPLANDLAAPLMTVLGTYTNQTNLGNYKLKDFLSEIDNTHNTFQEINLPYKRDTDTISYPMNWVLSDYNINRMQANLEYYGVKEVLDIGTTRKTRDSIWGVVFGGDTTLKAAKYEVNDVARKYGLENTKIYYRNGSYRSVSVLATQKEAEAALHKAKLRRKDSYIVNLRNWCPDAIKNDSLLICPGSAQSRDEPASAKK